MKLIDDRGFTVVELVILIGLTLVLFGTAIACNSIVVGVKAREAEVKANIHTIQIALERYAIDNDGEYPEMIWGGDDKSWQNVKGTGCRSMWENEPFNGKNEDNAVPPLDPLIAYGYLSAYPLNPFAYENGISPLEQIIKWTGIESAGFGDGDPRFGIQGNRMGNILEDPKYLWNAQGEITRVKNCLPKDSETNNATMINAEGKINPFYSMGGIPDALENHWTSEDSKFAKLYEHNSPAGRAISAYWPGEFFYRSGGSFLFSGNFLSSSPFSDPKLTTIWQFPYTKIDRYFLGGYGAWTTEGMDIIRMTDIYAETINNTDGCSGGGTYNRHPNYVRTKSSPVLFSSPEIMGGGNHGTMPYYPYLDPQSGDWMYGAPDGFRDGIILCLTSGT